MAFDRDLFDWYHRLIVIRKENRELSSGGIEFLLFEHSHKLLGFWRQFPQSKILVLLNNRDESDSAQINLPVTASGLKNLIDNSYMAVSSKEITVTLEPCEIKILKLIDYKLVD